KVTTLHVDFSVAGGSIVLDIGEADSFVGGVVVVTPSPSPSPSVAPTDTPSPTASPTPAPSDTPVLTVVASDTPAPTPTETFAPTQTPLANAAGQSFTLAGSILGVATTTINGLNLPPGGSSSDPLNVSTNPLTVSA